VKASGPFTPSNSTAMPGFDSKKRKGSPNEGTLSNSPSLHSHHKQQSSTGGASEESSNSPVNRSGNDGREGSAGSSTKKSSSQDKSSKRVKTNRACDSCRRKKIRCDVIDDGGPVMGSINNGNGGLICAHCKQYGFGAYSLDLF
jgi:hypothetical protein